MSKKEDAQFQQWKDEIKSKLGAKANKLAAFESLVAEDDEETREIFRGYVGEKELYRRMNAIHEEKEKLQAEKEEVEQQRSQFLSEKDELMSWYQLNKPKNERLAREKAELETKLRVAEEQFKALGLEDEVSKIQSVRADAVQSKSDSSEEIAAIRKELSNITRGMPALLAQYGEVVTKISRDKWKVEPSKVIEYSSKNNVDLNTAFDRLTEGEREERSAKEMEDLQKKWREEGKREALAQVSMPDRIRNVAPVLPEILRGDPTKAVDRHSRLAGAMEDYISMKDAGGMSL